MPAHKIDAISGESYWVGADYLGAIFVHSPKRQVVDFGMIELYEVYSQTTRLSDRLWPTTFASRNMHPVECKDAILRYLKQLNSEIQREIDQIEPKKLILV